MRTPLFYPEMCERQDTLSTGDVEGRQKVRITSERGRADPGPSVWRYGDRQVEEETSIWRIGVAQAPSADT